MTVDLWSKKERETSCCLHFSWIPLGCLKVLARLSFQSAALHPLLSGLAGSPQQGLVFHGHRSYIPGIMKGP